VKKQEYKQKGEVEIGLLRLGLRAAIFK